MSSKHRKLDRRVAVLPVIENRKKSRRDVVLVTSRDRGVWIIPTGKLEKRTSNRKVAECEAYEEAGVVGTLDKDFEMEVMLWSPCGTRRRRTTVYLLHVERVLERWPESRERYRKTVSLRAFSRIVSDKRLKKTLRALAKRR